MFQRNPITKKFPFGPACEPNSSQQPKSAPQPCIHLFMVADKEKSSCDHSEFALPTSPDGTSCNAHFIACVIKALKSKSHVCDASPVSQKPQHTGFWYFPSEAHEVLQTVSPRASLFGMEGFVLTHYRQREQEQVT